MSSINNINPDLEMLKRTLEAEAAIFQANKDNRKKHVGDSSKDAEVSSMGTGSIVGTDDSTNIENIPYVVTQQSDVAKGNKKFRHGLRALENLSNTL